MGFMIVLDKDSDEPIFRQIIRKVAQAVEDGSLPPGRRLPSSRDMARRLGVNRSTVCRAYDELAARGLTASRPGAHTVVTDLAPATRPPGDPPPSRIPWPKLGPAPCAEIMAATELERNLARRAGERGTVDMVSLSPDPRLYPLDAFRKCMNRVLADDGPGLLGYGDPRGHAPLRDFIAGRMALHGCATNSDEVVLTTGAQGGIDLVFRLLAGPGRRVAVESPTYSRAIDALRLCGARPVPVPMTARGMDLDALEHIMAQSPPDLVYTIPNFHNPTGLTTDMAHRQTLLDICTKAGTPLVEDGFEEEMKYFGKAVPPIRSLDGQGVVIYLGTFSKVLFPGLRAGFAVAHPDCAARLAALQKASILSPNRPAQAALYEFCRQGLYDSHIRRMHRVYRKRMRTALAALDVHLNGAGPDWTRPAGGYLIWLSLPPGDIDENEVVETLLGHGVAVQAGSPHIPAPRDIGCGVRLRLSIAHTDEETINLGISRLARGLYAMGLAGGQGA